MGRALAPPQSCEETMRRANEEVARLWAAGENVVNGLRSKVDGRGVEEGWGRSRRNAGEREGERGEVVERRWRSQPGEEVWESGTVWHGDLTKAGMLGQGKRDRITAGPDPEQQPGSPRERKARPERQGTTSSRRGTLWSIPGEAAPGELLALPRTAGTGWERVRAPWRGLWAWTRPHWSALRWVRCGRG